MSTETNQPPKPTAADAAATKRLFAQLTAFFEPSAKAAGLALRPFSIATFTAMQLAGISVGSEAFKTLTDDDRARQLYALLVIQTAPLADLKTALRSCNGDFEAFYWDFVFDRAAEIPLEAMIALEAQLATNLPAVEAAQVEVQTPPSLEAGKGDKPPGNS